MKKLEQKEHDRLSKIGQILSNKGQILINVHEHSAEYAVAKPYIYSAKAKGWKIKQAILSPSKRLIYQVEISYRLHKILKAGASSALSREFRTGKYTTSATGTEDQIKGDRGLKRRILIRMGKSLSDYDIVIEGVKILQELGESLQK